MTDNDKIVVEIPGSFTATYVGGVVTGFTFSPHGSYAGYFGPPATLADGPGEGLDIVDTDGPFWVAVQNKLAERPSVDVAWEE